MSDVTPASDKFKFLTEIQTMCCSNTFSLLWVKLGSLTRSKLKQGRTMSCQVSRWKTWAVEDRTQGFKGGTCNAVPKSGWNWCFFFFLSERKIFQTFLFASARSLSSFPCVFKIYDVFIICLYVVLFHRKILKLEEHSGKGVAVA